MYFFTGEMVAEDGRIEMDILDEGKEWKPRDLCS
jgi:hypothetical protein